MNPDDPDTVGVAYRAAPVQDKELCYILYTYEFMTIDQICEYMKARNKPHAIATVSKYIAEEHEKRKERGIIFEGCESAMVNQAQHIAFAEVWKALNDPKSSNHAWAVRFVASSPEKLMAMSTVNKNGTSARGTRKPNPMPKMANPAAIFQTGAVSGASGENTED